MKVEDVMMGDQTSVKREFKLKMLPVWYGFMLFLYFVVFSFELLIFTTAMKLQFIMQI